MVHELRCYLGFGADGRHEAAAHGHLYLGSPALAITLLCGLGLGELVVRVARCEASEHRTPPRFPTLWLTASLSLLLLALVQEAAEGVVASAHGGLAPWAPLAHGGWLALPLCTGVGLAIALWLRTSAAVAARLTRRDPATLRLRPASTRRPRVSPSGRLRSPLALSRAGRAPPVADWSLSA